MQYQLEGFPSGEATEAPLTEAEWLSATEPQTLLGHLQAIGGSSPRKDRLFACGCCRRIWHLMTDNRSRNAVLIAEQFADGLVSEESRKSANDEARDAANTAKEAFDWEKGQWEQEEWDRLATAECAADAGLDTILLWKDCGPAAEQARDAVKFSGSPEDEAAERAAQADLLRHIVGNPFRPLSVPKEWPTAIISLAEALYQGDEVAFALHDALAEGGFATFAEHFRVAGHPKGCAWLDAILGKS